MTRLSSFIHILIIGSSLAAASHNASAQAQHDHSHQATQQAATAKTPEELADGVVQEVDKANGELTIEHGPLANVNMPGMTMAYKVQDRAMLDQVKAGDKIRLRVELVNGNYTITKLALAK
jgi:Cu/Ag efflux protein CusF